MWIAEENVLAATAEPGIPLMEPINTSSGIWMQIWIVISCDQSFQRMKMEGKLRNSRDHSKPIASGKSCETNQRQEEAG
jgi:hypothetical protein